MRRDGKRETDLVSETGKRRRHVDGDRGIELENRRTELTGDQRKLNNIPEFS